MSGDPSLVKGPLKGYHHETYVLSLPGRAGAVKVREPRAEILWFDRRCFGSEEELLKALQPHLSRIPDIVDVGGMALQAFIEGRTLGEQRRPGRRVCDGTFGQIVDVFGEMVRITPDMLDVERRCEDRDRAEDGDSDGFLERLVVFVEKQVYEKNHRNFAGLFHALGISEESFTLLRKQVLGLRERPFCLLHADLHRENFVLDPRQRLWVIDWELAMLGDPLYDLATHLYLMRYPADQEQRMVGAWCRVVEETRAGGSAGWEQDLPKILDFKRAQSVFTDVIRVALSLREEWGFNWVAVPVAAARLQKILTAAARPLGLTRVPSRSQIMTALVRWHGDRGAAQDDRPMPTASDIY
ncbi:phosphotransferase [Streptomyces sp. NPDC007929]|uniref:phosphotransferase n=1 Tax=unclassified Streptomyces TaxID=2593676 RepID=UPI0036F09C53